MLFEQGEGLVHGLLVGLADVRPLVDRPRQGGGLDGGEDQVEPGDRGALAAGFLGLDLLDLGMGGVPGRSRFR
jgi:hypothetical protein